MKIWLPVILIVIGLLVIAMIIAGSHGHWRFKYNKAEDWMMLLIIGLTLGIGTISLFRKLYK